MATKRFQADSFTPTQWNTAEEKATFANQLLAFIAEGFPERKFTNVFYEKLSGCFSMVAHYNRDGFFAEFFTCTEDKLRFVRCLTQCHCYGSPQFTFSDVERAISAEVRLLGYVDIYDSRLRRETETRERQQLAALQAKYQPADATSWEVTEGEPFVTRPLPPLPALPAGPDVQFSLFG